MCYPLHRWRRILAAGLFSIGLRLLAQDVTIAPLEWVDDDDPPDQLPQVVTRAKIEFPDELRKTPAIGYAVKAVYLDERGKYIGGGLVHATQPAYAAALEEGVRKMRFSPGKRDKNAVNTLVSIVAIFNPATASAEGPEATPRLLAVSPVTVVLKTGGKGQPLPEQVVETEVEVDATGRVAAVKGVAPEWEERFQTEAQHWRFAPARRAGQPVAATVRVPFLVVTSDPAYPAGKLDPPRPKFRARPVYPVRMRESGMRGDVVVEFVIDIEGRVRNAFVVSSLNPAFDEPALEAIRQWKFEPGRRDGRPAPVRTRQAISFQLDGMADGGDSGVKVTTAKGAAAPKDFTNSKPVGLAVPVYPYALLREKVEGSTKMELVIDTAGRVARVKIVEATRPEFGRAVQAAAELFTFQPAIKDGRPVVSQIVYEHKFAPKLRDPALSVEELDMLRQEEKKPESIVGADKIDARLRVVSQRPPAFPLSVAAGLTQGEAMLDVIIDTEGKVRLPRIVSASDEAFGYAAVQAVASWRFEPPKMKDKPVAVRVRVPLVFKAGPPPEMEPAK